MQKSNLIKRLIIIVIAAGIFLLLIVGRSQYQQSDFGESFGIKASTAEAKLHTMKQQFSLCADVCKSNEVFMQSIVFPELMRYSTIKDGIESESLKVLYVQLGKDYANFSIGPFQMKPSFAEEMESKAKQLLPAETYLQLQIGYTNSDEEKIRAERIDRLQDQDWQMIYLTTFILCCDKIYSYKNFSSEIERLQWYATIYNAGFDRTDSYIEKKISEDNFYLYKKMPGKQFKYAAIAQWYFSKQNQVAGIKQ